MGGGHGAHPSFHPDEFSNFLCLHALSQIHAPNLSTTQPLILSPPLCSVVLAKEVKLEAAVSFKHYRSVSTTFDPTNIVMTPPFVLDEFHSVKICPKGRHIQELPYVAVAQIYTSHCSLALCVSQGINKNHETASKRKRALTIYVLTFYFFCVHHADISVQHVN